MAGNGFLVLDFTPSSRSCTLALGSSTRTSRILLPDTTSLCSSQAWTSLDDVDSKPDSEQEEDELEGEGGGEEAEEEEEEDKDEEEDDDEEEEEEEDCPTTSSCSWIHIVHYYSTLRQYHNVVP